MRLFFLLLLFNSFLSAETPRGPITDDQKLRSKYFQLGVSGGTPAGLNFCVGYHFGESWDYRFTQVCGMHFGSTLYGLQADFGKIFYKKKNFRAYWAGSLRKSHVELTGTPVEFTGIGPTAGMNWHFFVLELGLYVGSGQNTKIFPFSKDPEAGSRLTLQAGFQLGLKALFWQ